MDQTILNQVEAFATNLIVNELPDSVLYHDISFTHRLVASVKEISQKEGLSDADSELLIITAWLYGTGYRDVEMFKGKKLFSSCIACTQQISKQFLSSIHYQSDGIKIIFNILEKSTPSNTPNGILDQVFVDAIYMDFAQDKGLKYIKKMYQELLLFNDVTIVKKNWYQYLIDLLENHQYYTNYGKSTLEQKKFRLIKELKQQYKDLENIERVALRKELDISDEELKSLKANLSTSKEIDSKTIQTVFKTTSKNHYTLNQMVDRKANIMISINAIIVSLLIGKVIAPALNGLNIELIPVFIMAGAGGISMFYAILAVKPDSTHGEFSEDEVRSKQGNLLFFGNFHNMRYKDYEWAFLQMLNDKDYLYTSMIRDIYFLGQKIKKKHDRLRTSLNVFLIGTSLTIISFLMLKFIV